MTKLVAVVATAASATVQTQCGTVSLDVANSLAVVALLGWRKHMLTPVLPNRWILRRGGGFLTLGRTRVRAAAGLVAWFIGSDQSSVEKKRTYVRYIPACLPIVKSNALATVSESNHIVAQ